MLGREIKDAMVLDVEAPWPFHMQVATDWLHKSGLAVALSTETATYPPDIFIIVATNHINASFHLSDRVATRWRGDQAQDEAQTLSS